MSRRIMLVVVWAASFAAGTCLAQLHAEGLLSPNEFYQVQERKLQEIAAAGTLRMAVFSDDLGHYACVQHANNSEFVLIDDAAGPLFDKIELLAYAATGKRLIYVGTREGKQFLVDGLARTEYEQIKSLTFSPDGNRVAFITGKPGAERLVIDGHLRDDVYAWYRNLTFSPDSRHLMCTAGELDTGRVLLLLDCRPSGLLGSDKGGFAVSPDSRHLACSVLRDGTVSAYLDGQQGMKLEEIGEMVFSPDSRRLAYVGRKPTGGRFIVLDEKVVLAEFPDITSLTFTPDSQRLLFVAHNGAGQEAVVFDGKAAGPLVKRVIPPLVLSPDGKHLAYVAEGDRGLVRLIVDGRDVVPAEFQGLCQEERDDALRSGCCTAINGLTFSRDGRRIIWKAVYNGMHHAVIDNHAGPAYSFLTDKAQQFRGDGVLEYLAVRDGSLYHVSHTPGVDPLDPATRGELCRIIRVPHIEDAQKIAAEAVVKANDAYASFYQDGVAGVEFGGAIALGEKSIGTLTVTARRDGKPQAVVQGLVERDRPHVVELVERALGMWSMLNSRRVDGLYGAEVGPAWVLDAREQYPDKDRIVTASLLLGRDYRWLGSYVKYNDETEVEETLNPRQFGGNWYVDTAVISERALGRETRHVEIAYAYSRSSGPLFLDSLVIKEATSKSAGDVYTVSFRGRPLKVIKN